MTIKKLKHTASDFDIWEDFRNGNRDAFALMYSKYSPDLFAYGYKLCRSKDVVRDASHDLFVDLWKKRTALGPTNNIKFYLIKSIRREIIRVLKKDQKFIHEPDDFPFAFEVTLSYETELIDRENREEILQQLKRTINNLSNRSRELIYLKFFEGLAYDEISELTDLNYQSVVNTIHRAIKEIRKEISHGSFSIILQLAGIRQISENIIENI